jgi:CubicO group peptidase (beta-lactamase class C family)
MMKILQVLSAAFCLLSVSAFAQNPNPSAMLDQLILDEMASENLPGVTTVIVKGGEVVWMKSYGEADVENSIPVADNTVFLLASISKVFTGTALMQLYEDGQLDLDEGINNYLPFPVEIPGHETDSITFRMLMTHTSSIQDGNAMDGYYDYPDPSITLADCIERYFSTAGADYNPTGNFLNSAPGTVYEYSNMATALSGYLTEVISGMPFDQYCEQNIFDPLCMYNTHWHMADFDTNDVARPHQYTGGQYEPYAHYGFADYPDGQLRTNITDMTNFLLAYLQSGTFNGNSILSAASVTEMLTPQVPSLDATQGLNWYLEELWTSTSTVDVWGHNGGESGASTDIYIDPGTGIGLGVFTNGEGTALYICDALYDYALGLAATGAGNPACDPIAVSETVLEDNAASLYPNPFSEYATLDFSGMNGATKQVTVYDVAGKVARIYPPESGDSMQIERADLDAGLYLYHVAGPSGKIVYTSKFMIR